MAFTDSLRKVFGLSEAASEEDIADALNKRLNTPSENNGGGNGSGGEPKDDLKTSLDEVIKQLRDQDEETQLKKLSDVNTQLRERAERLESALRLSEAQTAVQTLSEGKGYVLPVPAQEKLLQLLIKSPKPLADDIVKLFAEVKEKGLVELGERGRVDTDFDLSTIDDPVKQFSAGVERRMQENKVTMSEAMRQLSSENPALYKAYRNASFIEGEVK
jgi:hypothetical protein